MAAGSGSCLVIAAATVQAAFILDPGPPGPTPYHSWAPLMLFLAYLAVVTGLAIAGFGVATAPGSRRGARTARGLRPALYSES